MVLSSWCVPLGAVVAICGSAELPRSLVNMAVRAARRVGSEFLSSAALRTGQVIGKRRLDFGAERVLVSQNRFSSEAVAAYARKRLGLVRSLPVRCQLRSRRGCDGWPAGRASHLGKELGDRSDRCFLDLAASA